MLLQHYVPLREYVTVLKDVLKSPSIASTVATKDAEGNETRLVEAKITESYFIITCLKMITKFFFNTDHNIFNVNFIFLKRNYKKL